MRTRLATALLLGLALTLMASAEEGLAYVPASAQARVLGVLALQRGPEEDDIRLIGGGAPEEASVGERGRVFAVTLSLGQANPVPEPLPGIPSSAYWPDAGGRIEFRPHEADPKKDAPRNPWELRSESKHKKEEVLLRCTGTVLGGEVGGVAFVNGRTLKPGDLLSGFSVQKILPEGVLLERAGATFVVPRGKTTTVAGFGR